jgi:hypothetical protein
VGRNDAVQAEDTVYVGTIDAGLDLPDDSLQGGRARAALEVVAVERRELGSGRNHRYRFEGRDRPSAERARHTHRPAPADQVQRVHHRPRPHEIQDVVRPFGPYRVHTRRQRPVVDECVVGAGRCQRAGPVVPPGRGRGLDAVAGRDRRGRHPHRRGPAAD